MTITDAAQQGQSEFFKTLQGAKPFFLMAGPNVIQGEDHCVRMAKSIKAITDSLGIPFIFKASYDKANRTTASSFRGPGLEEGLRVLAAVKKLGIPVITDVHTAEDCQAVGRVADIIQIPAFLCRQTDLLTAAAKTGAVIQIKKGQWCAPSVMAASADKVLQAGNPNVINCERGSQFGYTDLVVDTRSLPLMRRATPWALVAADVTHALQQPAARALEGGGVASGGLRELIPTVARACVAVGVDGIFMEVHDDPESSPVDAPTQWPLRHLRRLLEELCALAAATRGRQPFFELDLTPLAEADFDPEAAI